MEFLLGLILRALKQEVQTMSQVDDDLSELKDDVAELTTVDQSAIALINGIQGQIAAAVAAAQAAGATPAQLQSLSDLHTAISAQKDAMAAAVAANTPAAAPAAA
jgi:hypothetical protein